jgi:hypothetical protein
MAGKARTPAHKPTLLRQAHSGEAHLEPRYFGEAATLEAALTAATRVAAGLSGSSMSPSVVS